MKKILGLALGLVLAGCGDLPAGPVTPAPVAPIPASGILVVRVIGPLSVLPLGFQLPLNGRGLRLVVTDAGGDTRNQSRVITEGSAFTDSLLDVSPGPGRTVHATIMDENGVPIAAGQVQGITITSNAFTNVAVILAPVARG